MSAKTLERTAQKRVRRTRSRTVSHLPAVSVSSLKPHEYDLEPACISLICPTCRTWVPISGTLRPKLVPHHTETAGAEDAVRCPGSHRLVVIDVEVERWRRRLKEGVAETTGRRSTRVVRKPKTSSVPAVMQMVSTLVDDKTARKLDEAHVKGCRDCSPGAESRCADGRRLAQLAAHTKRVGPARRKKQMELEDWNDRREWGLRLLHGQQWDKVSGPVADADLQRVRDALAALIKTLNPAKRDAPQLTDWERADLMSAITLLAVQEEQLSR
ncbi:hypothetical protein O1Q96_00390 (plasmid) [Streptomyces sp. Qhu-G9]|uniref:hypothetical protein n=1 Tax=Streptomyces sp. Qhu-G9 TaxID=3452799 RepID=UPI0022ABE67F|nr:hypothetical protein [Streptomyces aurantiacus]WAU78342.1 hypothetical protein O1Q96_00390 [Streptomyces aurantiacus]